MLDENARSNFGLDSSNSIAGSIPIRLTGRVATGADRDGHFAIEADLTPAQIDGFLPGWVKPPGKPARATFTLTTKPQSIHIDDLSDRGRPAAASRASSTSTVRASCNRPISRPTASPTATALA